MVGPWLDLVFYNNFDEIILNKDLANAKYFKEQVEVYLARMKALLASLKVKLAALGKLNNNNYRDKLAAFPYWPQVITLILIIVIYSGYRYFAYYNTRSDDSYVSANVINITALVSGPISKIYIQENQSVKKGDKLIEIDPRPYQYEMEKARANYYIAKTDYDNNKFLITVAQEKLKQRQELLDLSLDHIKRYTPLIKKGDLPIIRLIDIESKIKEQQSALIEGNQQVHIARKNLDLHHIRKAKAVYKKAKYLYNHTTLYAPTDGYITNFNLRKGQYVKEGDGLFALVETDCWWVVTRYRETSIRLIKPGDKAKIMLDMYPGKVFWGHVGSIGWGINRVQAGEVAPSTLAYLEATEDWIKIAQRFPVRIYFDEISPDYPLRIGASATTITYR